jgi:glycogen synthase
MHCSFKIASLFTLHTVKFFFAWRLPYNAKLKLSIKLALYGKRQTPGEEKFYGIRQ